ncbi:MAG: hypothetical protein Q4B29_01370 [Candidatus Saccharibacteria bacterium]|nr:hypothetical protein [Candidatus Saccharibacteria bacterium]
MPEILRDIYAYLPRVGEFFQRVAIHFMTPQLSFGSDMVFRLIIAALATGLVYFSAVLVLGRKLKLKYKDILVYLGVFVFLLISQARLVFVVSFNIVNNYALAMLLLVSVALIFRLGFKGDKWYKMVGVLGLGFLFGTSTEISPLAMLGMVMVFVIVQLARKKMAFRELFSKYRMQSLVILGTIFGLAFFYLGAGIGDRATGDYGVLFDYVSPMEIFSAPAATMTALLGHLVDNIQLLFFAVPLMLVYILLEFTIFKKEKDRNFRLWQCLLFVFCGLYIGASSVVSPPEYAYGRFMAPIYLSIGVASLMFIVRLVEYAKAEEKGLMIAALVLSGVAGLMFVDMGVAYLNYNLEMGKILYAIEYNPNGAELIVKDGYEEFGKTEMDRSLIFSFRQVTPFHW